MVKEQMNATSMGVVGLWPFLKEKGYEPVLRLQSTLQNHQPSQPSFVRVDVLGAFFPTVRRAYSSKDLDDAHAILEKDITQFGNKSTLVLYLDGAPALEKAPTTANREEQRKTNLDLAQKHLNEFETLVNDNLPLRKRHFVAVSKPLQKAFYWDRPARRSFAQYLKARG
ncbi:hypothetical protein BGZ72_005367 [Mortierella alpina]|nr:hypothetical protein BGZ72_005367 [Mortierella alpina]